MIDENNNKNSEEVRNVRLKLNLQFNFTCILALLFICLTISSALINVSYASDSSTKNKQEGQIQKADYEFKIADNKKRFQSTEKMNYNHTRHFLILLPDGNVLVRGGKNEIFYPETNKYVMISERKEYPLSNISGCIMKDENVLMIGRLGSSSNRGFELFDYKTKTFKEFDTSSFPHSLKNLKNIKIISPNYLYLLYSFFTEDKKEYSEHYLYNYTNKKSIKLNDDMFLEHDLQRIFVQDEDNLIFMFSKMQKNGWDYSIAKYSIKDNKYEFLLKFFISNPNNHPNLFMLYPKIKSYFFKNENKIYIFTERAQIDSVKNRENMPHSPIYMVDLNTKEFNKIGSLWSSGADESVQLKDGRIMFNSGKFYSEYVQHEIYDPKTNKSTFTASYPWHRNGTKMILLNDGSVLINGGYVISRHDSKDSYRYYPKYKKADEN